MVTKQVVQGADYVCSQRRAYFVYVLEQRSIPHITDGLKAAGRRLIWVGKNGEKMKTATLAGYSLPYHPHDVPDDVASLMASPYMNNFPLFEGIGAFGTLLAPKSYGAPRYTSIKISKFTQAVVLRDIEIIPMGRNYDDTLDEPKHFLPLIPVCLINPNFGIAGGFKSNILPRSLTDIVDNQIRHLEQKKLGKEPFPTFTPTNNVAVSLLQDIEGNQYPKWTFHGDFEKINGSEIWITKIPFGKIHADIDSHLSQLLDQFEILDIEDHSKSEIKIKVRLLRGEANRLSHLELLQKLSLINQETEIMNVIDFGGQSIILTNFNDVIKRFTDWRLQWYVTRYERLLDLVKIDIQKCLDVLRAIEKNVGGIAKKIKTREQLIDYLISIGIVHLDYIAALPVYRFTEEEANKTREKMEHYLKLKGEYEELLSSEGKRRKVYVTELKEILKLFGTNK